MLNVHSKIGGSQMARFKKCPGSVELCANAPDKTTTYAGEGTVAHKLAAMALTSGVDLLQLPVKELISRGYLAKKDAPHVNQEMREHVENYVKRIKGYKRVEKMKILKVEHAFDVSHKFKHEGIKNEVKGIADVVLIAQNRIAIIDFKYGRGIKKSPYLNDQLLYYAVGIVLSEKAEHAFTKNLEISLGIFQPRAVDVEDENVLNVWQIDGEYLNQWCADVLTPALLRVQQDNPLLVPGAHCTKEFCKAMTICPAVIKQVVKLAKGEPLQLEEVRLNTKVLPNPTELTEEDLGLALPIAKILTPWAKKIQEEAVDRAQKGKRIKGHKLVRKRGQRVWEERAEEVLSNFISEKDLYVKKLKPITVLERMKGVKRSLVDALCARKEGGIELVSQLDKRDEVKPQIIDGVLQDFIGTLEENKKFNEKGK